jgi:hypothetical protein
MDQLSSVESHQLWGSAENRDPLLPSLGSNQGRASVNFRGAMVASQSSFADAAKIGPE